jgi:hypothetical protein
MKNSGQISVSPHQLYPQLEKILLQRVSTASRIACIDCIAALFESNGWQLGSLLSDTVALLFKQAKSSEMNVRYAAIAAAGKLATGAQRSGQFIHSEILKIVKNSINEKDSNIRRICGFTIRSIADQATTDWAIMLDLALKERPSKRGAATHGYVLSRAHATLAGSVSQKKKCSSC